LRNSDSSFSGTILIDSDEGGTSLNDGDLDIEFGPDSPIEIRVWDAKRSFWDTYTRDPTFEYFRLTHSWAFIARSRDLDGDGKMEFIDGPPSGILTGEELAAEEENEGERIGT